jgi:hypothetical protein
MNNESTRVWATLRQSVLACVIVVGLLSIVATGGGGGGSNGGGSGGPTLGDLAGTWFGTLEDSVGVLHTFSITIDGSGHLSQDLVDGVDQGLTGTVSQTSGSIFNFTLSDGRIGGFIADAGVTHAAFLDEFFNVGVVQKGATSLPTYVDTDIVGNWAGFGVNLDSAFNVVQTATSNATVASDFTYTVTDSLGGITTGTFTTFFPTFGLFTGTFTTSSSAGVAEAFLSADKTFGGTWTCDTTDGSVIVGFPVDCSFFIHNKQ